MHMPRPIIFLTAAAGWLLGALAGCGSDQNAASTGAAAQKYAARIPGVPGIENFARVAPGLYRGGQPTLEGLQYLKAQGFKTVVTLRLYHSEKEEVEAQGMTVVEIPLQGDIFGSSPPTEKDLKLFFDTVLDPARQPVFIHCAHGKDRTGTMIALYRMEMEGWTAEEAMAEMQYFGYHDIYKDLIAFVRDYRPRGYRMAPRK